MNAHTHCKCVCVRLSELKKDGATMPKIEYARMAWYPVFGLASLGVVVIITCYRPLLVY